MASLDELEKHLLDIDKRFDADTQLNGKSFDKTSHNTLGINQGDPNDFTVFLPWENWTQELKFTSPDSQPKLGDSVLQKAFKHVLEKGRSSDKAFIDIAHLWDENFKGFFKEGNNNSADEGGKSVIQAIADAIDKVADPNARITVRFLFGDFSLGTTSETVKKRVEEAFWPDGKPIVRHQNATLYVGWYGPGWDLKDRRLYDYISQHADLVQQVGDWAKKKLHQDVAGFSAIADYARHISYETLDASIKEVDNRAFSWNHGKIVAVNGTHLLTGGANFAWTNASNVYRIVEQSCKLEGQAAVSAHVWQDYFFNYLNKPHPSDKHSFLTSANLSKFPVAWNDALTETGEGLSKTHPYLAPLSTDQYYKINKDNAAKGNCTVLTTSQLGDWHGSMHDLDYPVQVVQLIKDLTINLAWSNLSTADSLGDDAALKKEFPKLPMQGVMAVLLNALFAEDSKVRERLLDACELPHYDPYATLRVNPTAWASRLTRLNAIANATNNVVICQQRLVFPAVKEMQVAGKRYNENKKISEAQKWDCQLWPYDLLIAIAYAILPTQRGLILESDSTGHAKVQIMLSHYAPGLPEADSGWGDYMTIDSLKEKLKIVVRGIVMLENLPLLQAKVEDMKKWITPDQATKLKQAAQLFTKKLSVDLGFLEQLREQGGTIEHRFGELDSYVDNNVEIRRVLSGHEKDKAVDGKPIANHSKIVCVDDKMLYIGSDNAYPAYNEETGVWIDDQITIQAWKNKLWTELWKRGISKPDRTP